MGRGQGARVPFCRRTGAFPKSGGRPHALAAWVSFPARTDAHEKVKTGLLITFNVEVLKDGIRRFVV